MPLNNSKEHVDREWIMEKIGGHGGSFSYTLPDGLAQISRIGCTGKLRILLLNLLLFVRFLKRKIAKCFTKNVR